MPRTKTPKKKKMTLAEFKRRMIVGQPLTIVEFHNEPVNKRRIVLGRTATYVKLDGDGIKEGEYTVLNWPKSSELKETDDGFVITNKNGPVRYVWGWNNDNQLDNTTSIV